MRTRSLVEEQLAAGLLVAPFDLWLPCGGDYYVVCAPHALEREPVRHFRDWLLEAACATRWRGP